jgi:hypothetical protein
MNTDSYRITAAWASIPDKCFKKPKTELRIALEQGINGSQLPFETTKKNDAAPHWNVPATGVFRGGYETGALLAFSVMKQRRDSEFRQANKFQIQDIVKSLIARHSQIDQADWEAVASLYGQTRGFVGMLAMAVDYHLSCDGEIHDAMDETTLDEILADANRGLGLDAKAYQKWLYESDVTKAAKTPARVTGRKKDKPEASS